MEKQTDSQLNGFILAMYPIGSEEPIYVSVFDQEAEAGIKDYSDSKDNAVVFQSREALLPLASIEVEALIEEDGEELSAFDGFRILPFTDSTAGRTVVSQVELEEALRAFTEGN